MRSEIFFREGRVPEVSEVGDGEAVLRRLGSKILPAEVSIDAPSRCSDAALLYGSAATTLQRWYRAIEPVRLRRRELRAELYLKMKSLDADAKVLCASALLKCPRELYVDTVESEAIGVSVQVQEEPFLSVNQRKAGLTMEQVFAVRKLAQERLPAATQAYENVRNEAQAEQAAAVARCETATGGADAERGATATTATTTSDGDVVSESRATAAPAVEEPPPLSEAAMDAMSQTQLKAALKERKLKQVGKKADQLERLKAQQKKRKSCDGSSQPAAKRQAPQVSAETASAASAARAEAGAARNDGTGRPAGCATGEQAMWRTTKDDRMLHAAVTAAIAKAEQDKAAKKKPLSQAAMFGLVADELAGRVDATDLSAEWHGQIPGVTAIQCKGRWNSYVRARFVHEDPKAKNFMRPDVQSAFAAKIGSLGSNIRRGSVATALEFDPAVQKLFKFTYAELTNFLKSAESAVISAGLPAATRPKSTAYSEELPEAVMEGATWTGQCFQGGTSMQRWPAGTIVSHGRYSSEDATSDGVHVGWTVYFPDLVGALRVVLRARQPGAAAATGSDGDEDPAQAATQAPAKRQRRPPLHKASQQPPQPQQQQQAGGDEKRQAKKAKKATKATKASKKATKEDVPA